jgi:hypothetical protein
VCGALSGGSKLISEPRICVPGRILVRWCFAVFDGVKSNFYTRSDFRSLLYGWRLIGLYGRHGALSMTSASVRQSHHHHRISWRCAWNGHLESNQFRVGLHQWSTTLLTRYLCRIERAVMHEMSSAMGNCFHREMSNESVQNLCILISLDHCWQLAQFTS